jgi:DNA helicase-2/ATP-dependent DNA helicase PcrA
VSPVAETSALLEGLNPDQARAVDAPDGPLLIFAGAGSGKTRVLTHRIAHVLATRDVRPGEICAVTFTNKAAREMRARLEALLGGTTTGMWLGTFHSLGVRLLRRDGDHLGIPNDFSIYDEADRMAALRRALNAAGLDEKRFPPNKIGHAISAAKNELKNAADFAASATGMYFEAEVARVFAAYEIELKNAGALDFDDLLCRAVELFVKNPDVLRGYQGRFRHLFVDEYQDTNLAQYRMVSMLAGQHRNLTVVGDDDQSIYGWRGADVRNILSFQADYPDATVVTLEQNYRSTQPILSAAHSVIRHNTARAEKRLWTDRTGGEPVRLISVYDEQEESLAVCAEIEQLIGREDFSLSDCAVLYRTDAQSRAFEEALLRRGIPYRLVGGMRFYERREVKDVLSYMRLLLNPRDMVSLARVINMPRRKIGDKTVRELERLAGERGMTALEVCGWVTPGDGVPGAAVAPLHAFAEMMTRLSQLALRAPLPELMQKVIDETGYGRMLRDGTPEGDERWSNLQELEGLAGEYLDHDPPNGLRAFLENVALVSDVDSLDREGSGVTLITLHQVKGLEFPVVFIAGMEEGLLPHMRALEEGDDGIAEERRLAYVGMTRAQRRLYLLHAYRRHLFGSSHLAEASRFLADLPLDEIDAPRRAGGPPVASPRAPGAVRAAVHAHAVRENPVQHAPQRFAKGMRVEHPKYGEGNVMHSTMTRASGEEVMVRFDEGPPRLFAIADSGLRLLEH